MAFYYIDDGGELYKEVNTSTLLRLSDGKVLLKFEVTALVPTAGNPMGLLLSLTYS